MNLSIKLLLTLAILVLLSSCNKKPGEGGKGVIKGRVIASYVKEGSFDTLAVAPYPDERVYIVYGEGAAQDDDQRTNPNGNFEFKYLNQGKYVLYTYSESKVTPSGKEAVYQTVFVNHKEEEVSISDFHVVKYVK